MNPRSDEHYMKRAIELALNQPMLPFGAVIVDEESGEVVAEGWNRTSINPTWHGEIDAINNLASRRTALADRKLVLYTTAEPCPMCQGAILWSGIGKVVFGTSIPFLQSHGWKQIEITASEVVQRSPAWSCVIVGGVLEKECNALFERATAAKQ